VRTTLGASPGRDRWPCVAGTAHCSCIRTVRPVPFIAAGCGDPTPAPPAAQAPTLAVWKPHALVRHGIIGDPLAGRAAARLPHGRPPAAIRQRPGPTASRSIAALRAGTAL
jgi:hypothetical protein